MKKYKIRKYSFAWWASKITLPASTMLMGIVAFYLWAGICASWE